MTETGMKDNLDTHYITCIYTSHTLNHLKELGLDHEEQKAHKTALKLHAHSVLCTH